MCWDGDACDTEQDDHEMTTITIGVTACPSTTPCALPSQTQGRSSSRRSGGSFVCGGCQRVRGKATWYEDEQEGSGQKDQGEHARQAGGSQSRPKRRYGYIYKTGVKPQERLQTWCVSFLPSFPLFLIHFSLSGLPLLADKSANIRCVVAETSISVGTFQSTTMTPRPPTAARSPPPASTSTSSRSTPAFSSFAASRRTQHPSVLPPIHPRDLSSNPQSHELTVRAGGVAAEGVSLRLRDYGESWQRRGTSGCGVAVGGDEREAEQEPVKMSARAAGGRVGVAPASARTRGLREAVRERGAGWRRTCICRSG